MTVRINESTKLPGIGADRSATVMVNNPHEWPMSAFVIPHGTNAVAVLKPTFSYATSDVNWLSVEDRNCLFPVQNCAAQ